MRISTDLVEQTPEELAYCVKCAIEGFAKGAAPSFRRMRLPPLYESGIRFAFEADHGSGCEDFAQPVVTYDRRAGDCDDLVIYRLCEFYSKGDFGPTCSCVWTGEAMHVQVRLKNGKLEDPAILCGAPWQELAR